MNVVQHAKTTDGEFHPAAKPLYRLQYIPALKKQAPETCIAPSGLGRYIGLGIQTSLTQRAQVEVEKKKCIGEVDYCE